MCSYHDIMIQKKNDLMMNIFVFLPHYNENLMKTGDRRARFRSLSEQQGDFPFSRSHDLSQGVTAAKLMKFTAVFTIAYCFMEVIDKSYNIKFNGRLAILMTHFPS